MNEEEGHKTLLYGWVGDLEKVVATHINPVGVWFGQRLVSTWRISTANPLAVASSITENRPP